MRKPIVYKLKRRVEEPERRKSPARRLAESMAEGGKEGGAALFAVGGLIALLGAVALTEPVGKLLNGAKMTDMIYSTSRRHGTAGQSIESWITLDVCILAVGLALTAFGAYCLVVNEQVELRLQAEREERRMRYRSNGWP